jgi:hypothetical protein
LKLDLALLKSSFVALRRGTDPAGHPSFNPIFVGLVSNREASFLEALKIFSKAKLGLVFSHKGGEEKETSTILFTQNLWQNHLKAHKILKTSILKIGS